MTLSNNTNGLKFRSYQTLVDIQTGFIDGKVCNIPLDITLAGLTEKPYALLINSCNQNGKQIFHLHVLIFILVQLSPVTSDSIGHINLYTEVSILTGI